MKITGKKFSNFAILLIICLLFTSCHKKSSDKNATSETQTANYIFSARHDFPNNVYIPRKDTLPNQDVMLHKEIVFYGDIPTADALYDITLEVEFLNDIDIAYLPMDITAVSPDSNDRRTNTYKIDFNDNSRNASVGTENGKTIKRHTHKVFTNLRFPVAGKATFYVEMRVNRFPVYGIKSLSIKAEKNNSHA